MKLLQAVFILFAPKTTTSEFNAELERGSCASGGGCSRSLKPGGGVPLVTLPRELPGRRPCSAAPALGAPPPPRPQLPAAPALPGGQPGHSPARSPPPGGALLTASERPCSPAARRPALPSAPPHRTAARSWAPSARAAGLTLPPQGTPPPAGRARPAPPSPPRPGADPPPLGPAGAGAATNRLGPPGRAGAARAAELVGDAAPRSPWGRSLTSFKLFSRDAVAWDTGSRWLQQKPSLMFYRGVQEIRGLTQTQSRGKVVVARALLAVSALPRWVVEEGSSPNNGLGTALLGWTSEMISWYFHLRLYILSRQVGSYASLLNSSTPCCFA